MELSLETYRLITKYVGSRTDLCTLCRVNVGFQQAAEQALYNTIDAWDVWDAFRMCRLFSEAPRVAGIVEALTLFVGDGDDSDGKSRSEVCLPDDFWPTVSEALHNMTKLRFLNLHLDNAGDSAQAWILDGTTFRLHSFHCDLQWDAHLVSFFNTQPDINDIYIVDYSVVGDTNAPISTSMTSSLDPGALPKLSTLECTFTEAACALVPARPISRLKTCFSKTRLSEKREELSSLFSKLMATAHPLRSLDIADSSYSDSFTMDILSAVVKLQSRVQGLRYLGTLVLPVDGQLRLKFYGLLRGLRFLQCIEVDVSEWNPPLSIPAGMRALASELRLYCSSIQQVIFVNDFERTVITASCGYFAPDNDTNPEHIWREF